MRLLVLLLASVALAQAKPDTERAADAAQAAFEAKDEAALRALALRRTLDPWKVADELCFRGAHDTAAAFAREARRKGAEKLAAYVAARRGRPPNVAARRTVAAVDGAPSPAAALAIAEKFEPQADLDSVRVLFGRANVLRMMGRYPEAARAALVAADAAEKLGWMARASLALRLSGFCAGSHGDWDAALAVWKRSLPYDEALEDGPAIVWTLTSIGKAHRQRGRLEDARACFERAVTASRLAEDLTLLAETLLELGDVLHSLGRYDDALRHVRNALRAAEQAGDRNAVANALLALGAVQADRGARREAFAAQKRALALFEELGDAGGIGGCLANLGTLYEQLGSPGKAREHYERALALARASGDRARAAMILGNLGDVHSALGSNAKARACLDEALRVRRELGDRAGEAASLVQLGLYHLRRSAHVEAAALLERGRKLARELGLRPIEMGALLNLGTVHAELGRTNEAFACFERALTVARALGDPAAVTGTLANIGAVHFQLGACTKALEYQQRALEMARRLELRQGVADCLVAIGKTRAQLGAYADALTCFEQALALLDETGNRPARANVLADLGWLHLDLGDLATARTYLERALAEAQALEQPKLAAAALGNLGILHQRRGEIEQARACYERARAALEELGDRAGVAACLMNLGGVCRDRGDHEAALAYLERALRIEEEIGDRDAIASTLLNVGHSLAMLGRAEEARRTLERSVRMARAIRATPWLVAALTRLAMLHLDEGDSGRALGAALRALREVEGLLGGLGEELGASARARHTDLFAVGAVAALREDDPAEALTFLESGRAGALLDALGKREALRWKAESLPPELRHRERGAQAARRAARLAYDRAAAAGDRSALRAAAAALDVADDRVRAVAGRIQRELKQQAGLFYPRAETIDAIQAALADDEALVLYGLCRGEAFALVVRRGGARVVELGPVARLAASSERLRAADPASDPAKALAAARALLVAPLAFGDDVARVLISPEGPLCYLPFAALFDRPLALTPSGTTHVLLRSEAAARGTGVLALGDPDYTGASAGAQKIYYAGRPLARLPATRAEASTVGTKVLLGADASEAGLRAALSGAKRWRAVHFACHGLVNAERPMLSALALARTGDDDGFLTAAEILHTRLPADLAVLSACETARGRLVRGEGIVGLTRAFMFAGAPRVLVSLWKVDDEATRALMVKFYELWKEHPTAVALAKAQAFVRGHEKWRHPYYWAAWQLWGLPE